MHNTNFCYRKYEQCDVDSRVDEAEHRLVLVYIDLIGLLLIYYAVCIRTLYAIDWLCRLAVSLICM